MGELPNVRNCQSQVLVSEPVRTISARDASASENKFPKESMFLVSFLLDKGGTADDSKSMTSRRQAKPASQVKQVPPGGFFIQHYWQKYYQN